MTASKRKPLARVRSSRLLADLQTLERSFRQRAARRDSEYRRTDNHHSHMIGVHVGICADDLRDVLKRHTDARRRDAKHTLPQVVRQQQQGATSVTPQSTPREIADALEEMVKCRGRCLCGRHERCSVCGDSSTYDRVRTQIWKMVRDLRGEQEDYSVNVSYTWSSVMGNDQVVNNKEQHQ